MPAPLLEEVFKLSGVPTFTFVKPVEYRKLLVSLRTPGRGLVVEGPSGIGKTTSVSKALEELGTAPGASRLSARIKEHLPRIAALPDSRGHGVVIIDDFHRLDDEIKRSIADYLKTLADEEDQSTKLVIVGINKAGDTLVKFASDLNNRIDTIRFERNPEELILRLVKLGEQSLNVTINTKDEIAREAQGSFHLAQIICHETCLQADVLEKSETPTDVSVSIAVVREHVLEELSRTFFEVARKFATGPKLRRAGRAPYLHMLHWLATENEWSIYLDQAMVHYPEHRPSVGQVVEKRFLENFIRKNEELFSKVIHYDASTHVLSVEDPKFVYFLRNLLWSKFAKQVGYLNLDFKSKYDFALSFAGVNRALAETLNAKLSAAEAAVFYDKNEQHRILAENVEDYLGPIYSSEARFVVPLMSQQYPVRIWTKFESEQFKQRFGDNSIIPVWYTDAPPGMFDPVRNIGSLSFDPTGDVNDQATAIAETLLKKLQETRLQEDHQKVPASR